MKTGEVQKMADPQNLRSIVEHLALDIGPRPYSKKRALDKARDTIAEQFEGQGRSVFLQEYRIPQGVYSNIIVTRSPLSWELLKSRPALVVGAHYDTVSTTPGADDNASGIACLVELSRTMGDELPANVILACFTLEEPPFYRTRHMGSYRFAKLLKKKGVRLKGMICLEMIGYFKDSEDSQHFPFPLMDKIYPTRGNFIGLVGDTWSRRFTKEVENIFTRAGTIDTFSLNAPFWVFGVDLSDHWSFYKFGYKALMVTDTAFYRNPNYHKSGDLPHTLDFEKMAGVVDALCAVVRVLAPS